MEANPEISWPGRTDNQPSSELEIWWKAFKRVLRQPNRLVDFSGRARTLADKRQALDQVEQHLRQLMSEADSSNKNQN